MPHRSLAIVLLFIGIAAFGCSGDSDNSDPSNNTANPGAECTEDADCSGGSRCMEDRCEPFDAPDQGSPDTGEPDLMDDSDLVDDSDAADAPDNTDTDLPPDCERTRCDNGELIVCNDDGQETRQTCPPNSICQETSRTEAECVEQVCEPNEKTCTGPTTVERCNASGTNLSEVPCRDGQVCEEGSCIENPCPPGRKTCEGNNVVICRDPGESDFEATCEYGCLHGHCLPPPASLRVDLTWGNRADAPQDLDIRLLDINHSGSAWNVSPFSCYWSNASPNWGDVNSSEDDPSLDIDLTRGPGPEIITISEPANGTYRIGVHHFNARDRGETDATIKVYLNETLAFEATQELEEKEFWEVADITWQNTPTVVPVNDVYPDVPLENECFNDNQCFDTPCINNSCAVCTEDAHCGEGYLCHEGACLGCLDDNDCTSGLCSPENTCVACFQDDHCDVGQSCISNTCLVLEDNCWADLQEPNNTSDAAVLIDEISHTQELAICSDDEDWFYVISDIFLDGSLTLSYSPADADLKVTSSSSLNPNGTIHQGENGRLTISYQDIVAFDRIDLKIHSEDERRVTYTLLHVP